VQVVNYSDSGSAEEICEVSSKIITFLDLAGHQKYLKTTIFGLTGHIPDFAMLVIAANAGVGMYVILLPAYNFTECFFKLFTCAHLAGMHDQSNN
jgi:hypothetical protein